jgi:hypothetical protein
MNIAVLKLVVLFYEHCRNDRKLFMNITVICQAVWFYEH